MNTEIKLTVKAIASKMHHHLMVGLQLCIMFLSLGLAFNSNAQTVTYIHTDGLGSPVAKSDASGALISNSRTRYEPYGMEVAGTATPTIGFTGHVNDADTGLTYMQQRYYDSVAGRFLSTDPVLTDQNTAASFNRYVYANNNSYKYIDPDGREVKWIGYSPLIPEAQRLLKMIEKTPIGKKLVDKLNEPGVIYTIRVNNMQRDIGDAARKYIDFDPTFEPKVKTSKGNLPIPADVAFVHEIGHTVGQKPLTSEKERDKLEKENLEKHENPYRKQRTPEVPKRIEY